MKANCLGQLVDKRDQDTCPNLRNLSQKSSAELKDLCIIAYEEQIRQLVESEGPDTKLERTLKRELAEVTTQIYTCRCIRLFLNSPLRVTD